MNKDLDPKTENVEILYSKEDFEKIGIEPEFEFTLSKITNFVKEEGKEIKRYIKGYAATKDKDRCDDIITIEALTKAKDDLLGVGARTVFLNHDRSKPIGKSVSTSIDTKGLIVKIAISMAKDVEDTWTKIKEGILNSLSIGGRYKKVQVERDEEGNPTAFKILELELMEVSVVGIPMNAQASIFDVVEKSFSTLKGKKPMSKEKTQAELDAEKEAAKLAAEKATIPSKEGEKETGKDKAKVDDAGERLDDHIKEHVKAHKALEKEWSEKHNGFHKEWTEKAKEHDGLHEKCQKALDSLGEQIKSLKGKKDGESTVTTPAAPVVPVKEKTFEEKMLEFMQKQTEFNGKIEAELKAPTRKGVTNVDEIETETETEVEIPGKALKDADDAETVAFVKLAMNDMDVYKSLSEKEQEMAKNIYMVLLGRNARKIHR